jgi:hypothetical protein
VEENNFLKEILSESNSQPKSSLSDQMSQMIANIPKEPSLSDIVNKYMNPQAIKDGFEPIEQNIEIDKQSNPPRNPKYAANNKNFAKLVDSTDAHESKITDLADTQICIQNEIIKINTVLKKHGNDLSHKSTDPSLKIHGRNIVLLLLKGDIACEAVNIPLIPL